MEQELIELLLASKKALSTGQSICAQANTYLQTSEGHVETIAKIHPKLLFVDNHILVQCKILEGIRDYMNVQTESCQNKIKVRLDCAFYTQGHTHHIQFRIEKHIYKRLQSS